MPNAYTAGMLTRTPVAFLLPLCALLLGSLGGCSPGSSEGPAQDMTGQDMTGQDMVSSGSYKRMFVTSTLYKGDLGGLAGADLKCQNAAVAIGLSGQFKAWLSMNGALAVSALSRINDVGPWLSVDGKQTYFNNKAGLATSPLVLVSMDEKGKVVNTSMGERAEVWTGTAAGGTATQSDCRGWMDATTVAVTGTYGLLSSLTGWTDAGATSCSSAQRLYCIEQ